VDVYVIKALFSTITNVNFDPRRLEQVLRQGEKMLAKAQATYEAACKKAGKKPEQFACPAGQTLAGDLDELIRQGQVLTIAGRIEKLGPDVTGLQELLLYGLKCMAAHCGNAIDATGLLDMKWWADKSRGRDWSAGTWKRVFA
jgi:hydroxylamine reductase